MLVATVGTPMPPLLQKFINDIAALVFPASCFGCNRDDHWLCPECVATLMLNTQPECPYCRTPSARGRRCPSCQNKGILDGLIVAAPYNLVWKKIIHQYKFSFVESAAHDIFKAVATSWQQLGSNIEPDTMVLPVPLSHKRQLWRGFNQSAILGRLLAKNLGLPYGEFMQRSGKQIEQSKLTRTGRLANAARQTFSIKHIEKVPPSVIIVDDVYTTGATMEACAQALRAVGVKTIWGCVIARGVLTKKS